MISSETQRPRTFPSSSSATLSGELTCDGCLEALLTYSATTHSDLLLRASDLGVPTTVIHNASILTALGSTGLQMYSFGQTLSLPFYTETWAPSSWYDRLEENLRVGMHTLILVDIKVREQSEENMAR
jgi:diphthine synthase